LRIACAIEYDGAHFHGWQRQRRGTRTAQAVVEEAFARIADHPITTVAAGRTDAGVHATGQVVHFDVDTDRPDKAWVMGANTHLPDDVAVRWAQRVPDTFDARFSAIDRSYSYFFREGSDCPALWRRRVGWSRHALDTDLMDQAGQHLLGERDFSAFRSAACQAEHAIRRIDHIGVSRHERVVRIDVRGNAFLHNMVRIIAGVLRAVGRGHRSVDWVDAVLASRDRRQAGATAPAGGLYFLGPRYSASLALPPASGPVWPGDPA
jgi:tRNA pseudouridine38-40 synthase